MSQTELTTRNVKILQSWVRMLKTETCNKTLLGNNFGVSPRTVGRILKTFGLAGTEEEDREIIEDIIDNNIASPSSELRDAIIEHYLYDESDEYDESDDESEMEVLSEDSEEENDSEESETTTGDFAGDGEFIYDEAVDLSEEETILDYTIAKKCINIILESGDTIAIPDGHDKFQEIRDCLLADTEEKETEALRLASKKHELIGWANRIYTIRDNQILMKGEPLSNDFTQLVLDAFNNNRPFVKFLKFHQRLIENPSYRVVNQMIPFMRHNDIELDDDGFIIAWKSVSDDYTDMHTGKIDNSVGKKIKMPRNEVDDDPDNTCSAGLHICAREYIGKVLSVGRVMRVRIDPYNIVCIPYDYQGTKCRCCEYEVLEEVSRW